MAKKITAKISGIRKACLNHLCQDALALHHFTDTTGKTVWTGVVSDGCSGAYGSEYGSAFLSKVFIEEVEHLGTNGNRKKDFLRNVMLAVVQRMASYKSQKDGSGSISYGHATIHDELFATLYAFVADQDMVWLVLSGDGMIAINGHRATIDQVNGDQYVNYVLAFPEDDWVQKIEELCYFVEFPRNQIQTLLIATDGFKNPRPDKYGDILDDPPIYMQHAAYYATRKSNGDSSPNALTCRKGDDATAILIAFDAVYRKTISFDNVQLIKDRCANHGTDMGGVLEKMKCEVIQKVAFSGKPKDAPGFRVHLSENEGVEVYGVTDDDRQRYLEQQSLIIASHPYDEISFMTGLFGSTPKTTQQSAVKKQPAPAAPTARATGQKKGGNKSDSGNKAPVIPMPQQPQSVITPPATPTSTKKPSTTKHPKAPAQPRVPASVSKPQIGVLTPTVPVVVQAPVQSTQKGPGKKQKKLRPEWSGFNELCDYDHCLMTSIGFRHFPIISDVLWHFVNDLHKQGYRIGNMRPQDLEFSCKNLQANDPIFAFRVRHEKDMARVDKSDPSRLVKGYGKLDEQFVHPRFFDQLTVDDNARIDHDFYSYKTLLFWIFTKADPFGTGTVIDHPEADRRWRMMKDKLCTSNSIHLTEKNKKFITVALGRLSYNIITYLNKNKQSVHLREYPTAIVEAFKNNIFKCDNLVEKEKRGKTILGTCNFPRLSKNGRCPLCDAVNHRLAIANG